jgi:hypothetical protein
VSQIYLVVALRNDEVEICEAFFAVPLALGRAFQVATNMAGYNISTSPGEETMPDGSTCWTFLNTAKHKVKVFLREIADSLPSHKDPMSFLGGLSNTKDVPKDMASSDPVQPPVFQSYSAAWTASHSPQSVTPKYDFCDRSLPAGWFYDGKPALMGDLLDNPYLVKDPLLDLTEDQKWALIEVRVRKSPGFHSPIGTSNHTQALKLLSGKDTGHGLMLRDEEIEALHALREDLITGTQNS